MTEEEIRRLERGLITVLVRAAQGGNASAAKAAFQRLDAQQGSPKRRRRRISKRHAKMGRREYLEFSLGDAERSVLEAQDDRSWQAVINGKRLCLQIRTELDALDRPDQTELQLTRPVVQHEPAEVARRILDVMPTLMQLAPPEIIDKLRYLLRSDATADLLVEEGS